MEATLLSVIPHLIWNDFVIKYNKSCRGFSVTNLSLPLTKMIGFSAIETG